MIIVKTIKLDSNKSHLPYTHLNAADFEQQLDKLCTYLPRDQIDDFKYNLKEHMQATSQYPQQKELLTCLHYFFIHFSESPDPQTLIENLASHLTFSSHHVHHYLEYLIHSIHPPKDIQGLLQHVFEYRQLNDMKQDDFFSIFNTLLQMSSYPPELLWKQLLQHDLILCTQNEQSELKVLFDTHASKKIKHSTIEKLIQKTTSLDAYQQLLHFTQTSFQSHHLKSLKKIIQHPHNFDCALSHFQQIPFYTHQLDNELLHQLSLMTQNGKDAYRALICLKPEEQLRYLKPLQSQLEKWIQGPADLIRFLKILSPESQLLIIKKISSLPIALMADFGQFMDALQLLPPDAQKIYLPHITSFPIKNGFEYSELLERIHLDNHEILLKMLPPLNIIHHGYELECFLHRLNPKFRESWVQKIGPTLPYKTIHAESLMAILEEFDDEKREDILNIFQPQISNIITGGKQLCELLFCFEKNKREQVLKRFSKQEIAARLKDIYLINYALITLPQRAKDHFIQEHLPHILILVQKSEQLNALMHVVPLNIKLNLLKHFHPRLPRLFQNEQALQLFLNEFPMNAYRQIIFLPGLYSKFPHALEPIFNDLIKYHQITDVTNPKDAKQILEIYYELEDFMTPKTLNQNFFGSSMDEQNAAKELLAYFKNPINSFDHLLKKYKVYFEKSPFKEIIENPVLQNRIKKETQHEKTHVGQKRI